MYKNIIRTAFLFATGIFMTACSSGDDELADSRTIVTPDTKENTVTLTGTISTGSDITRAVADDGTVSWKVGDEICVQYKDKDDNYATVKGTITEVDNSDTKKAKFTATLTNLDAAVNSLNIGLAYPYSNVIAGKATSVTNFAIDETKLAKQAGTIAGINDAKLDIAWTESEVPITINWTKATATLNNDADLSNQVCLCKFSLRIKPTSEPVPAEGDWPPLSATKLEIMLGSSPTAAYTITPAHSTDVFYVVMQPHSGAVSLKATYNSASTTSATELVPSSINDGHIGKIIAVNPNEGNKAYLVNMPDMSSESTLTKEYGATTKLNKGKFYKQNVDFTTTQYLPVAVIAHVGAVSGYWTKFLALALEDVTSGGVSTAGTSATLAQNWVKNNKIKIGESETFGTMYDHNYDEVIPNVNATPKTPGVSGDYKSSKTHTGDAVKGWRIPSVTDWRYIIWKLGKGRDATEPAGIGDHEFYYPGNTTVTGAKYSENDVDETINDACGNEYLKEQYYWSSSYYNFNNGTTTEQKPWRYSFVQQYFVWNSDQDNALLRAVFAY